MSEWRDSTGVVWTPEYIERMRAVLSQAAATKAVAADLNVLCDLAQKGLKNELEGLV